MIFALQAGALRAAVATALPAIDSRSTIPILANLHLEVRDNTLFVQGTNLEIAIGTSAAGDGELEAVTVAARRLASLLALIPAEETVTLARAKEGQLCVETRTIAARLFTEPAEDFPKLTMAGERSVFHLDAGALHGLLDKPFHAISTEETRCYLNGIFLEATASDEGAALHATATDGYRLFTMQVPVPEGSEALKQGIIIPRLTCSVLRNLVARAVPTRPIEVTHGNLRMEFSGPGWRLHTKLIDGTFPDYRRVIPNADGMRITVVDPKQLAVAITTVTSIGEGKSRPIKLMNGSGTGVRLEADAPGQASCSVAVPTEAASWTSDGKHPEICFQGRYMLDICRTMRGGFEMHVLDGTQPCRIVGPDGLAVLMPMRV